ncbi:MAG TPA: hypothetical protein K8W01_14760 [Methylorubrum populi]|uniref:Uncharacterized protein n=1 Tax=Methylorubrum populi TaxID=223967 RepID=A0A921E3L8_9HYPH|nr:hypothetical protein [Methylorubrum populi]
MRVSTRIVLIRQQASLMLDQTLSAATQAKTVADYHRERIAEAEAVNRQIGGRTPDREDYVNGSRSQNFEAIQPGNSIISRFELVTDLFAWIRDQLRDHSPVLTGAYRESHTFYADGVEADPANPPEADEYAFLSGLPYSRKIEGIPGVRKPQSKQAHDGVYQAVATLAARRFGNSASIFFAFRSPLLSYVAGGANRAERAALRNQPARRSVMALERQTRVPAVIIRT